MNIRPIKTEVDYEAALERLGNLMNAEADTPEGDELDQGLREAGEAIQKGELNWADEFLVWFTKKTPFALPLARLLGNLDVQKLSHLKVSTVYGWATEMFLTARRRRGELTDTQVRAAFTPADDER